MRIREAEDVKRPRSWLKRPNGGMPFEVLDDDKVTQQSHSIDEGKSHAEHPTTYDLVNYGCGASWRFSFFLNGLASGKFSLATDLSSAVFSNLNAHHPSDRGLSE